MTRLRRIVLAACLALLAAAVAPAGAQAPMMQTPAAAGGDAGDIERLLNNGRAAEALARADRALAARPGDAQLRFLRGVALSEAGRADEALAEFTRLTQAHPDLPEPYNNLAVLHAAQGRFDAAREALEAAVRSNPGYATAHENLGDVYARLAAASYARARQLDGGNRSVAPKLAALRGVFAVAPAPAASAAQR